eukprot:181997_1
MIWLYLLTLITLITYGQEPEPTVTIPNEEYIKSDTISRPLFDHDSASGTYIKWSCPITYVLDASLSIDTNIIIEALVARTTEYNYLNFYHDIGTVNDSSDYDYDLIMHYKRLVFANDTININEFIFKEYEIIGTNH